ncbi:MAG: DUF2062 domain-containing protein [Phycisphaerae bacterium]|nr:DUF2062 domain-containing protein [Phycisphaerae bacterium]
MPHRYIARKAKTFFLYRVLHVDDTPHRIALGVAIGVWAGWMPIVGIQMITTFILAACLRANKAVGMPWVWVSNPATMAPMYLADYWVGCTLIGRNWSDPGFLEALNATGGWWNKATAWLEATRNVVVPLMLGGVVVGVAFAVPTYFLIRWSVVAYRRHRRRRRKPEQLPDA